MNNESEPKREVHQVTDLDPQQNEKAQATRIGVDTAKGIIDILADPKNTTTQEYSGNMAGNKSEKLSPNVPESFMYYDSKTHELEFKTVNMYNGETGEPAPAYGKSDGLKDVEFSSAWVVFKAGEKNPIANNNTASAELSLEDFRVALNDPSSLQLQSISGSWFDKDNPTVPGTRNYLLVQDKKGELRTFIDEDSKVIVVDAENMDNTKKATIGDVERIAQIVAGEFKDLKDF